MIYFRFRMSFGWWNPLALLKTKPKASQLRFDSGARTKRANNKMFDQLQCLQLKQKESTSTTLIVAHVEML